VLSHFASIWIPLPPQALVSSQKRIKEIFELTVPPAPVRAVSIPGKGSFDYLRRSES